MRWKILAFRRYIHKHGKKLGPYYYENVRGPNGKVKTVYLGTNPNHHTKHRIRKPLFFLILILILILILGGALFFIQNKAYLINKVTLQEPDFDVDQILIKVLVRSGEFIEKEVRIMNTGDKPISIDAVSILPGDIVKIDSASFSLKPGQTKIASLNFSSYDPINKIEQQPGIYVGKLSFKSEKSMIELPMVVEIETKSVLFDINLNPVAIERKVKQGSDTTIEVRLFNLESIESVNVDVEYFVKDMNGNTIITESETVVVKTQASFFKTISIPKNLKPGPYVFSAQAKLGKSVGTASYLFEVVGQETESSFVEFCKNNILCLGLSLTSILLLFSLMAFFYFFIGAYLYERITGAKAIPEQGEKAAFPEEAAEVPQESLFSRLGEAISKWKKEKERKKAERLRLKRELILKKLEEKRIGKIEFEKIRQDSSRQKEDLRRQHELAKLREERASLEAKGELKRSIELEKLKLKKERKKTLVDFLHNMGLYKTPEEMQQLKLQKEREKQEELGKSKDIRRHEEEERKKHELLEKRQRELEDKLSMMFQDKPETIQKSEAKNIQKEVVSERLLEAKKGFQEFFQKIGLYKTPEERKKIALEKEKEKKERQRLIEEEKKRKELERKKEEDERKRKEALSLRQKESEKKETADTLSAEEELKFSASQVKKREEERERLETDKIRQESLRKQEIERQKAEQEKLKKEESLRKKKEIEAKRKEEAKKQKAIERKKLWEQRTSRTADFLHGIGLYKTPEERKKIVLGREKEKKERQRLIEEEKKRKELEIRKKEEDKNRMEAQLARQKEIEEKRKGQQRLAEEKSKLIEERRKKLEEQRILAAEMKKQLILKKQFELEKRKAEEEKKERQRLLEEGKKREELERKKEEDERKRQEAQLAMQKEIEQRKQIEQRKKAEEAERRLEEESKKQRELEAKRKEEAIRRILDEKRKLEEERKRKIEEEKKKNQLEKQKFEQLKVQKSELIRQLEIKLARNHQNESRLNTELGSLEEEKKKLSFQLEETDSKVKDINEKIDSARENYNKLKEQKNDIIEKYSKQFEDLNKKADDEKKSKASRISELKARLAEKENGLIKDLEKEMKKLAPEKRKQVERWKRLEIKAKIKLQEQELRESGTDEIAERIKQAESSKKAELGDINKKLLGFKKGLEGLESKKHQIILDKKNAPSNMQKQERKIKNLLSRIDENAEELVALKSELAKLKNELSQLQHGFLKNLFLGYKEKIQTIVKSKEDANARLAEEKRRIEEEFEKREEKESLQKKDVQKKLRQEKFASKKEIKVQVASTKNKIDDIFAGLELPSESQEKSCELEECDDALQEGLSAIANNRMEEAKKHYLKARDIYMRLGSGEKKKVYSELMDVYNRLVK